MLSCRTIIGAVALLVSTALPSLAEDFALLLTNRDYTRQTDALDAARHDGFKTAFELAGFSVMHGQDLDARGQSRIASEFARSLRSGRVDRVVVVLSGHFAQGPTDSWLLARDSGKLNALRVGQFGLSITAISDVLAGYDGKALVVLTPSRSNLDLGFGLEQGVENFELPQGVTRLKARTDNALVLLRNQVLAGRSLAQMATNAQTGVSWAGFLPDRPLGGGAGISPGRARAIAEESYWSAARDVDTIEAYGAYLRRYPNGEFATAARNSIADIRNAPLREAQATEAALNLSREARRNIQRQLSFLGYDTRGVDGIFGQGTRRAIALYQRNKGVPDTGYVSGNLITLLNRDVDERVRQQEEEERERRLEQERRDRDFWQSVGSRTGERGLRQYLRQYPDGIYADRARRELAEIEDRRRDDVDQRIRVAWDQARSADTIAAYRDFLRRFPNSQYQTAVQERIAELEEEGRNREAIERDKAQEAMFVRSSATRLLIEKGLQARGYQPGVLDGKFDKKARRAIRKFQRANGLAATGYVSQKTMLMLLVAIERN
ncbi:MAG: peptidoglycan-binding protein [Thalassovita sp.]